jgi:hypothetical protein
MALDFLTDFVRLARRGDNPLFPSRAGDVFANCNKSYLDRLEKRISTLSNDLRNLWTARGELFISLANKQGWMLKFPDSLVNYLVELVTIRKQMQKRRPLTLDFLKSTLVKYVRDATGGKHSWHDAELALLCNEDRRAWSKWRVAHYQPPPPPTTERRDVIKPIHPIKLIES